MLLSLPALGEKADSMSPLRETREDPAPLAVDGLDVTTYFDEDVSRSRPQAHLDGGPAGIQGPQHG